MKYRKMIVNCDRMCDNCWFTIIVQVKKWYGWVTVKTMESNDYEYIHNCADEILDKLNEQI